jgi:hypothetical protein
MAEAILRRTYATRELNQTRTIIQQFAVNIPRLARYQNFRCANIGPSAGSAGTNAHAQAWELLGNATPNERHDI